MYGKCPIISFTKVSDKMAYANGADPDQILKEQSDQGLHCLAFHSLSIIGNNGIKSNI